MRPETAATIAGGTWWGRVLGFGFGLYLLGLAILMLTGNPVLFPTVEMLGTFLVPVAYVTFFYDHRHLSTVTVPVLARGFLFGGVLGVFGAAILEPILIHRLTVGTAFAVGLIEEGVKLVAFLVIARRLPHTEELDGLILGAAAGMGFAALESNGYAFTMFLASGGNLSATAMVTLFRGVLAPVGHGTWTAILGGVVFRESRPQSFRITRAVLLAYLTVAALHGLWDGLPGVLTAVGAPGMELIASEAVVGLIGFIILWRRWREAVESVVADDRLPRADAA